MFLLHMMFIAELTDLPHSIIFIKV